MRVIRENQHGHGPASGLIEPTITRAGSRRVRQTGHKVIMNEPENDFQSASREAMEENCGELRRMVNLLFGALVVSSFTLTAYLGLEGVRAAQEAAQGKQRLDEIGRAVQQDQAVIQVFYSKLEEFARTHPDFQNRVLSKYTMNTGNPPASGTKK